MYELTSNPDTIRNTETQTDIPRGHRFWDEYEAWLAAGNVPLPAGGSKPEVTEDEAKADLRERITARRWELETGGITIGGITVNTGLDDQNRITSVLASIALGVESVDFKTADGWVTLAAEEIQGIAAAIGQHIQACFTAERRHHEAIENLYSRTALAAYEIASGWPSGVY